MRKTLVAAFLLWPALARGASDRVDWKRDVQPIFQARCTRCHGAEQQRSQLRLDSRTGALRGGMSGAVVLPGDSRGSALVQRITGALQPRMPFEGSPLPAEEIARIQAWIDAGAPGAVDVEPPTSGIGPIASPCGRSHRRWWTWPGSGTRSTASCSRGWNVKGSAPRPRPIAKP
jgi:hypothetical protein